MNQHVRSTTTEELLEELKRRLEADQAGLCAYCLESWKTHTCKFDGRLTDYLDPDTLLEWAKELLKEEPRDDD